MSTVRGRREEKTRKHQEIEEDVIKPECVFEYDRGKGGVDVYE